MASTQPPTRAGTPMTEAQAILCPICHKPNLRRARFCQHCGHDIVLNNDGPCYYITRIIKAGGQGAVYQAIGDDGHVYAVKEMLDRFADAKERTEAISRFEAEAKMLQRLSHPRIPRVYADFKDEGRHYLSMDFVEGEDLEEIIKRQGAIPEKQVLEWADQLCDVLDYLHDNGLIYRDMKPSNVMIDHKNGGIKLVDFGIAKVFQHTERGTQIGTPGYAPPEQYQGMATPESDIYALCATLHHMLTGRDPRDEPPFSFPPVYGLKPNISKRTSEAIQHALQMKPEDRYRSVAELRAALRPQPIQPPQVRVAPATQALPAQPQVAAVPTPTQAQPPQAPPVVPTKPAQPAPVAPTKPAQPAPVAPTKPAQTKPQLTQAQKSLRRRQRIGRTILAFLLLLTITGGILAFGFPQVVNQYIPGLLPVNQPTPQTLVTNQGVEEYMEIILRTEASEEMLREQFTLAYVRKLEEKYGSGSTYYSSTPPQYTAGGEPKKIGEDAQGVKYRATMKAELILIPK